MNRHAIIELEPADYTEGVCALDETGKLVTKEGTPRETLLYAIYDLATGESMCVGLFEEYGKQLEDTIWAMANACEDCSYWTATEIDTGLEELTKSYRVVIDPGTHRSYTSIVPVLIDIPKGRNPQMRCVLFGHWASLHFYALPNISASGQMAERMCSDPTIYPGIIQELSDPRIVLKDSCFQISGFGPDLDGLRIVYSPQFSRQQVREILKMSYGLPYYRIKLTAEEYDLWLDGHCGFEVDLEKRELI